MSSWELEDERGRIPELLEARPELEPDLEEWLRQFRLNPYELWHTFPDDAPQAMGKTSGWWYPVRPFLFEIVLDEAEFGVLTGVRCLSTNLWDRSRS